MNFNPRPPCGGRQNPGFDTVCKLVFQSTPPVRGATRLHLAQRPEHRHFNPRPPCGGRRVYVGDGYTIEAFQSTPPVRGATINLPAGNYNDNQFQSTPPVRGATPCAPSANAIAYLFQSTPPVRGATVSGYASFIEQFISIHAPRAGGDAQRRPYRLWPR